MIGVICICILLGAIGPIIAFFSNTDKKLKKGTYITSGICLIIFLLFLPKMIHDARFVKGYEEGFYVIVFSLITVIFISSLVLSTISEFISDTILKKK